MLQFDDWAHATRCLSFVSLEREDKITISMVLNKTNNKFKIIWKSSFFICNFFTYIMPLLVRDVRTL